MRRLHLFEWEDFRWFPRLLRDYMTGYLSFVSNRFDLFEPILALLERSLKESGHTTIVDLASGGGGGWRQLAPRLAPKVPSLKVLLTDLYPNKAALRAVVTEMPELFTYEDRPVDALQVPPDLHGFRTQFLSFHHFAPLDARQILQNAVDSGMPIGVFEAQKRDVAHLLSMALVPLMVVLMTPLVRPFRLGHLLFTYAIPLLPILIMWDGLVSVLRTYSVDEMRAMVAQLERGESYHWEIGEARHGPRTVLYLVGYPK